MESVLPVHAWKNFTLDFKPITMMMIMINIILLRYSYKYKYLLIVFKRRSKNYKKEKKFKKKDFIFCILQLTIFGMRECKGDRSLAKRGQGVQI